MSGEAVRVSSSGVSLLVLGPPRTVSYLPMLSKPLANAGEEESPEVAKARQDKKARDALVAGCVANFGVNQPCWSTRA